VSRASTGYGIIPVPCGTDQYLEHIMQRGIIIDTAPDTTTCI
jgi:hypothetical protein